jgi:hypothetical protein
MMRSRLVTQLPKFSDVYDGKLLRAMVRQIETLFGRVVSDFDAAIAETDHGALTGLADQDHPASAIVNTPAGNIAATDVQAALNELDSEKAAVAEPIAAAHIGDTSAAHAASAISNVPAGSILSTEVQAAINELAALAVAPRGWGQ